MKIPEPIIVPTIKLTPPTNPTRLFNSTVVLVEPKKKQTLILLIKTESLLY